MGAFRRFGLVLLMGTVFLYGCVAFNTLPIAARPGDTITVAIGSADGATTANTTAIYYPDSGGAVPLPIKSVFNLYPDRKTQAVANSENAYWNVLITSGHEPWITIAAIDLPTTGLIEGTGHLIIDTPATYPTAGVHVNQVSIALEILPGTGTPHPLSYQIGSYPDLGTVGQLSMLENVHQLTIKPLYSQNSSYPTYGAIELTLKFVSDGAPPAEYKLIADDVSPYTGSERAIYHTVSGDELKVMYVSPTGLLMYYEPRFSVIPLPARSLSRTAPSTMPTAAPIVSDVKYYDVNGNLAAGPPTTDYAIVME